MPQHKLSDTEIEDFLSDFDEWGSDGKSLSRRYEFKNFAESLEFVNKVGTIAEDTNHHPDIEFGWGYANITLTSHDSGGITAHDLEMVRLVENV